MEFIDKYYHNAVLYEFILASGVAVALSLLIVWHLRMISFNETNVEVHINKKETTRLKAIGIVSIKCWFMVYGV